MAEMERESLVTDGAIENLVGAVIGSGAVAAVRSARLVEDGMQHRVVVLDEELVARFPRDEAAAASLHAEAALLTRLAGQITAPLPVPVFVGESFTLHRMLHGSTTSRSAIASLTSRARDTLVDDAARFLSELESAEIEGVQPSVATTSIDRIRRLRARAEEHLVPLLWRHQRDWLEQVFADVEGLSFGHVPTLIHGDLAPYHVLHDADTGQVTGVLDFGVAGLGDPAVDLGCLLAVWGERFAGGLARHWPTAAVLVARARVLAALMPVEWAVIALETGDPAMAVAHIGHVALDIAPAGSPLGPNV